VTAVTTQTIFPSAFCQVLASIGEQLTEGDDICGVAVLVRPVKDRLELWTKTAANEALQVLQACGPGYFRLIT
jgi:Eukaryotic initiation factor 4E